MAEEWRPIPGFAAYEITESRKVRQRFEMTPVRMFDGTVQLWKSGKRYHRSVDKLVREAFEKRDNPILSVEGFRVIPDFPGYSINREGDVFNERSRRFLEHHGTGSVQLVVDGKRYHRTVASLVNQTF